MSEHHTANPFIICPTSTKVEEYKPSLADCNKQALHVAYKLLAETQAPDYYHYTGLCRLLHDKLLASCPTVEQKYYASLTFFKLREFMRYWPKATNNPYFPVPRANYEEAQHSDTLYAGSYGALRKELAYFLMQEIEPYLEAFATRSYNPEYWADSDSDTAATPSNT